MFLIIVVSSNRVRYIEKTKSKRDKLFMKACEEHIPSWNTYSDEYKQSCLEEGYCRFGDGFVQVTEIG